MFTPTLDPKAMQDNVHSQTAQAIEWGHKLVDWQLSQAEIARKHADKQTAAAWDLALEAAKATIKAHKDLQDAMLKALAQPTTEA